MARFCRSLSLSSVSQMCVSSQAYRCARDHYQCLLFRFDSCPPQGNSWWQPVLVWGTMCLMATCFWKRFRQMCCSSSHWKPRLLRSAWCLPAASLVSCSAVWSVCCSVHASPFCSRLHCYVFIIFYLLFIIILKTIISYYTYYYIFMSFIFVSRACTLILLPHAIF